MNVYIEVITTTDSEDMAVKIGQNLVESKLAAGAQVSGPFTSIYHWKGKIENTREWYCVLITRTVLFKDVERAIKEIHPYEVPQIISLPISDGSRDYLDWIRESAMG